MAARAGGGEEVSCLQEETAVEGDVNDGRVAARCT